MESAKDCKTFCKLFAEAETQKSYYEETCRLKQCEHIKKADVFHFHEIMDRCHTINTMIDELLVGHPGMTPEMSIDCTDAQRLISTIMNRAAGLKTS